MAHFFHSQGPPLYRFQVKKKNYEFIEHTADLCIRVKAGNLSALFKNAALAVFEIIATPKKIEKTIRKTLRINQKADNLEELFVNWLNELLSLSSAKDLIFYDFKIDQLDEQYLKAQAFAGDIKDYKVNTEIKAATYHELKIAQIDSGWQAEVILDV